MFRSLILISLLVLSGCAGLGQIERVSDLSVEQLRQVNNIQFYASDKNLHYSSIGRIKGISCKGSPFSGDTSKEAAMMQLRIKAVKIGANAVLFSTCSQDASVDWGNNCWASWVCIGEAAILKE